MPGHKKIFYCICLFFSSSVAVGQNNILLSNALQPLPDSSAKLYIKNIVVKGNKRTKEYIILREIQFQKGDSLVISTINQQLEQARQQVYNTTLFSEVKFETVILSAFDMVVTVDVKERWYIYPVPQFKPVDRNFNEWIKTYNASLKRVNYGLKFVHYNLTGRRDQLRIFLLTGFSRDFSFSYNAPYSNAKLTEGFVVGAGYSQKKEIPYKTDFNNKLLFYRFDSLRSKFVGSNFNINAGYSLRKGFFNKHSFNASFSRITVSDSIVLPKNNPNYFNNNKTAANIFEVYYTYQHVNVNNVLYATKGKTASISISKRGLGFTGGINALTVEAGLNKYYDLGKKWYSTIQLNGKIRLPFQQAYINQRGLGYGDSYLRGQEYLVIDGVATALIKSTLKYKVAAFKIPLPFKIKSVPYIPFTIFAKTYADLGYAFNKKEFVSNLNNKLLYTGGFGIDILTFYDINLRLEYSFNQLNQKGLFLHTQSGF
ncbi:POTRA domain-containing protein [Ferruginibacter sp.]